MCPRGLEEPLYIAATAVGLVALSRCRDPDRPGMLLLAAGMACVAALSRYIGIVDIATGQWCWRRGGAIHGSQPP